MCGSRTCVSNFACASVSVCVLESSGGRTPDSRSVAAQICSSRFLCLCPAVNRLCAHCELPVLPPPPVAFPVTPTLLSLIRSLRRALHCGSVSLLLS